MSNHREHKKRRTFAAILDAAAASFDTIGYDATSMETIAQTAGVSPGTVYNYFGTKNAILAAIVTGQVDEIMGEAAESLDLTADDPADALMPMLGIYLDRMTDYGPDLLKELFAAGFDPAQTDLLADFVSADERVLVQLGDSLVRMQTRGLMSLEVDVGGASLLIYSIVAVALMMFMSVPGTTPSDVRTYCRSQLGLAFDGLGIRHDLPKG
jgi:AcrR family transcriptional regulator